MKNKTCIYLSIGLILISFLISIFLYPMLPERIVTHWNYMGVADGYMSKFIGLFLIPIAMVFSFVLSKFFVNLDPRIENIKKSEIKYNWFLFGMTVFFFGIHVFSILWNLGIHLSINRFMAILMAFLFYNISILMTNLKQNYFIGIKTPWTLHSELVWDKTHIVSVKLFKTISICCLLGFFFPTFLWIFMFIPIFTSIIFLSFYSYLEFKKINKK